MDGSTHCSVFDATNSCLVCKTVNISRITSAISTALHFQTKRPQIILLSYFLNVKKLIKHYEITYIYMHCTLTLHEDGVSKDRKEKTESLTISRIQGSKWDGMDRYGIPALPWLPGKHTDTSFLRKDIPVCFAGHFVRFRQLVTDVCINQWPK